MRVTIGIRLAKKSPILTYTDKIYSPSVDTDGSYFYTFTGGNPQPFNNMTVKFINIPVKMSANFNQMIWETVYFFHFQTIRSKSSQNCATTGSPQVDRKKALFHGN